MTKFIPIHRTRRAFTLVQAVVVIVSLVALAIILFPVFVRSNPPSPNRRSQCQSNLQYIGLGLRQYMQDYDTKWPLVAVNETTNATNFNPAYGWADAIQPYIKSVQIYQCPSEKMPAQSTADAKANEFTDYWFNARMAGFSEKNLSEPALTIIIGDGNDGIDVTNATNARYSLTNLPQSWRDDANSPLYRHLEGANYGFADGHVKWMKPPQVTMEKPGTQNWKPTLLPN